MKLLVRAGIVLLALAALRFVLPIGLAWAYYRSTPDFETWTSEHPTADHVWHAALAKGTPLGTGFPWVSPSDQEVAFERSGILRSSARFEHGDQVLLDCELEIQYAFSQVEGWDQPGFEGKSELFEGMRVDVLRHSLHPDFHGFVVVSLRDLPGALAKAAEGEGGTAPPTVLHLFVLSGPGELEVVVRDVAMPTYGDDDGLLGGGLGHEIPFHRVLLGLAHPPGAPVEEGVAFQARLSFQPAWSQLKGGSQGPGFGPWKFGSIDEAYSVRIDVEAKAHSPYSADDHWGVTVSSEIDRRYTWNGVVW